MGFSNNLTVPDDGAFDRVRTSAQGPEYNLGEMRETNTGKRYRYCKFVDAVTYAAGHSVEWANVACTSVTNDRSGGSSLGRMAAGVCVGVPAENGFGWVQTWGPFPLAVTSGADDIAAGENVFVHATTDGAVDGSVATAATVDAIGYALDDDAAANTVTLFIRCW